MMNVLVKKMERYKSGDKEALTEILLQMEPLVMRYAGKTFSLEFEDAKQEYYMALIHACSRIQKYEDDVQCLKYFQITIKNKYNTFCKDYFLKPTFVELEENIITSQNDMEHILLKVDVQQYFEKNNGAKNTGKQFLWKKYYHKVYGRQFRCFYFYIF